MRRTEHRRVMRAVDAWVDAELDAPTTCLVAGHLDECWDCSAMAETAALIKRSLRRRRNNGPPALEAVRLARFAQRLG